MFGCVFLFCSKDLLRIADEYSETQDVVGNGGLQQVYRTRMAYW